MNKCYDLALRLPLSMKKQLWGWFRNQHLVPRKIGMFFGLWYFFTKGFLVFGRSVRPIFSVVGVNLKIETSLFHIKSYFCELRSHLNARNSNQKLFSLHPYLGKENKKKHYIFIWFWFRYNCFLFIYFIIRYILLVSCAGEHIN